MVDYVCFEIDVIFIVLLSRFNLNFIIVISFKRWRYKFVYFVCVVSLDMEVIFVYFNFYFNFVS